MPPASIALPSLPSAEASPNATPMSPLSIGDRSQPGRQMIYSAIFGIAAPDADAALERFVLAVENAGGYLELRQDRHVVCRIPAAGFQDLVALMPNFGSIVSQSIRNEDVTSEYRDLNLRIETADWSRRRVLALLEKADEIEDVIRLESELLRLTALIEGLKGTLSELSEKIAYSKIDVTFTSSSPSAKFGYPEDDSPFAWINRVGVDNLTGSFGAVDGTEKLKKLNVPDASSLLPGGISIGPLDDFLVVKKDREELKAITPDASKLWLRQFEVSRQSKLDFWAKALENDLVNNRGYALVEKRPVEDRRGHDGMEFTFDVVMRGTTHRYLIAVYVLDGPIWKSDAAVRTVEFAAAVDTFAKYVDGVRQATTRQ